MGNLVGKTYTEEMKADFEKYITDFYGEAKAPQILIKVGPSDQFVYADSRINGAWLGYKQGVKDATERLSKKKELFSNTCRYSAFNDTVCNKCGEIHKLNWFQVKLSNKGALAEKPYANS